MLVLKISKEGFKIAGSHRAFLKRIASHYISWGRHRKNPAYGRHQLSRPMRIVGPIQFWRGCVIYRNLFIYQAKQSLAWSQQGF